jgi:hypothetical protein
MKVAGVKWIGLYSSDNVLRGHFRKLHDQSVDYGEEGIIPIGRREVARLDNDPNAPENGRLSFLLEGGQ